MLTSRVTHSPVSQLKELDKRLAHGMINNLGDRFPNPASTSTGEKTSLTNRIGLGTSIGTENLGRSGQAVPLRKSQTSRVGMD